MVNMAKVELELITDPEMYIFFEKRMRGSVSSISNRYNKANNKYLKSYNPKKDSKHIIYLDPNNMYNYAMSKFLPTSVFKWIDAKESDLNKHIAIVQKDVFRKLILNTLKSYENYTMIIH